LPQRNRKNVCLYTCKMKNTLLLKSALLLTFLIVFQENAWTQTACTTLGQTPATAFPVCGTTTFRQLAVPLCRNANLVVPGCSAADGYGDKNPFYYRFTCFTSGTLAFTIAPLAANEDYDWQLYDITGRNPNDIFTNASLVVGGNWAGTYANTGASSSGVNNIECGSDPAAGRPTFHRMPTLIQGHEYLLMVSHYSDTQAGYNLSFGGGTAVITDPTEPHLQNAVAGCDGRTITVKLNKKVRCNSITPTGSDFTISPAVATVVSATTDSCAFGFDFDEITLTLSAPLSNGNYQLVAALGSDGNTLLDFCDRRIPTGESVPFVYAAPAPIRADSVGRPACASDSIKIFYPKKIKCSTISPSGGDFAITGPTAVTVASATGNCVNDLTDYVVVKFIAPILTAGNYTVLIQPGIDGSPVFDLCGQPILPQTLPFTTADTVNANFQFNSVLGCQQNTVTFSHNGANGVSQWNWVFNGGNTITTQTHTINFPATSTNTASLWVSNGVCTDTSSTTIVFDNEVKAAFSMDKIICPEDGLVVTNNSTGTIDSYVWQYDVVGSSNLKDPPPFLFPTINREAYYTVKLIAENTALNCKDSTRQTLTVLDFCLIEVPTAFTPNNDGRNDFFHPHNALKADGYQFKVYNRYGQLVFQSKNWQEKWYGTINGTPQPTGVYVWMLSYTHRDTKLPVFKKGHVTLIR
jgi:gliding motility-associated-like protein